MKNVREVIDGSERRQEEGSVLDWLSPTYVAEAEVDLRGKCVSKKS